MPPDDDGKAVVLSFWATWCLYCRKELPVLNAIKNSAAKDRIEVIAVNIDERDVFRGASRALSKVITGQAPQPSHHQNEHMRSRLLSRTLE